MKVAIYARVSTLNQAQEGYSISGQVSSLTKYCEAMGYEIYDEYVDAGFSGGDLNRPAMQKMLKDVKNKKVDAVIIYKLDRMSRSVTDTLYLVKDTFDKNGIHFISLKENLDTSSAMGGLIITMLSAIAEFEREQIKERLIMGKIGRAKAGKAMSWSIIPFGYDYKDDAYFINEFEASLVEDMFKEYVRTGSLTGLATSLNEKGHLGKEKKWTYRTVKSLLENPVYIGKMKYKGEVYQGTHESIVSEELFNKAQMLMEAGRRKSSNPRPFEAKYMLSGLIRCGECGAPMMSILDRKKADGTRVKRYRCKSKKKYPGSGKNYSHLKCDNTSHRMDVLEDYVIDQIEKLRIEPDNFDFNHTESNDMKIKIHENELARLEGMLNKVLDLYINGDIPKDNLNQRREKINEDIAKNEAALEELKADNEDEMKKNALNELNKLDKPAKTLSYEEKFKLVRKLLKEVTVYKDKVVLDWAFAVTKS